MFPFGSYFLNIPPPEIQEGELIPRGFIPTLPLPLDDITYIEFEEFLIFLCYPDLFHGNEDRWQRVCVLANRWHFFALQHHAYLELQYIRYRESPPFLRRVMMNLSPVSIRLAFRRRNNPNLIVESDIGSVIGDD
jgi:hypothetical protein